MDPAAPLTLNHITDRDSMSKQYHKITTHQPKTDLYSPFSFIRPTNSKRNGLCVSFDLFQRYYLTDGQVSETVVTIGELSDLWNTGTMDEVPMFVANCSLNLSVAIFLFH